jgi:hypothetical protein
MTLPPGEINQQPQAGVQQNEKTSPGSNAHNRSVLNIFAPGNHEMEETGLKSSLSSIRHPRCLKGCKKCT